MIFEQKLLSDRALIDIISLSKDATAVYTGDDLYINFANNEMLSFWGKDKRIIGMPLETAVPELDGQPFIGLMKNVWRTGETFEAKDMSAELLVDGLMQTFYFDFVYRAILNEDGSTYCILHTATEVSERIRTQERLEQKRLKNQLLNEELAVANDELSALNEEYTALNEQLSMTNTELIAINDELADSNEKLLLARNELQRVNYRLFENESHLRSITQQAPIGLCVLKGPKMLIEMANDIILGIWGRTKQEVLNKPHRLARPEVQGQLINEWLEEVYETGVTKINTEIKVLFYHEGGSREAYVNSVYQPLLDSVGNVTGVIVILEEITEKVKSKLEAQRIQEMFNLAVEAADLGTFDLNPVTGLFTANDVLKDWFGLEPKDEIRLEMATGVIDPADQERIVQEIHEAMKQRSGGNYEVEYTIINPKTKIPRVVRAKGRVLFDPDGEPVRFTGTVQDVTERKLDDNRKDDFIAMVSHELKTPLTSAKGYIQLLNAKAKKEGDQFTCDVLGKTETQVNKMQTLIKSFLDVARLESGKIQLDLQLFNIKELITEVAEESITISLSHQVTVPSCAEVSIVADRDKIGQVITNFMSNAIKYSPEGSKVELNCTIKDGFVVVSVKDEGIGIHPSDHEKLFDRFYRVEGNYSQKVTGFGVGLYLCSEIINHHKGKVWVESAPGEGAVFSFSLPLNSI